MFCTVIGSSLLLYFFYYIKASAAQLRLLAIFPYARPIIPAPLAFGVWTLLGGNKFLRLFFFELNFACDTKRSEIFNAELFDYAD